MLYLHNGRIISLQNGCINSENRHALIHISLLSLYVRPQSLLLQWTLGITYMAHPGEMNMSARP
jgi:hypothetical protein